MSFEVVWGGSVEEFEKQYGEVRLDDEWERKNVEREGLKREAYTILAKRFKKNVLSRLDAGQKEALQEVLSDCRGELTGYRAWRILEHLQKIDRLSGEDLNTKLKEVIEDELGISREVNYLISRVKAAVRGVGLMQKEVMVEALEGQEPSEVRKELREMSLYYNRTFQLTPRRMQ